jgi:peptidoglycan/xylan/chitin deacetylase (PgdA/CDA1 family)
VLRQAKILTLDVLKSIGAFDLLGRSNWRLKRLLILAYHGVSQHDEHLWNPSLYMTPEMFRHRMELLRENGCNVIPLSEAVKVLATGNLPEKSVVLTFDDGFYSFYEQAYPIIEEFGFPVTVYLTTYYSAFNRPVFDVMCSYLQWKGRHRSFDAHEFSNNGNFDLRDSDARSNAALAIRVYARNNKLSAEEKNQLLTSIAHRLNVDYESMLSRRMLHLLSPSEVTELAAKGVDIQLHTHRHCAPENQRMFMRELEENKNFITQLTNSSPSHFCYPSGVYNPQYFAVLNETNVVSATTCDTGLATQQTQQFALPRLIDTSSLQPVEFESWLCGLSNFLPRRRVYDDEVVYPYYY